MSDDLEALRTRFRLITACVSEAVERGDYRAMRVALEAQHEVIVEQLRRIDSRWAHLRDVAGDDRQVSTAKLTSVQTRRE